MIKINQNIKKNLPKIIIGIIVFAIAGVFVRASIWEKQYIAAKNGTERSAPLEVHSESGVSDERVTEVKPTPGDYQVPADHPRFISVEKIGVKNARIIGVGVRPDGAMGTPYNIYDAGWYVHSGKPGKGGTLLMNGHNGGPTMSGIFKKLPTIQKGDIIEIERGDGARFKYSVVETYIVPLSEADKHMDKAQESPVAGTESLTLITCTGEWSQPRRTYLSRQFLRAVKQD